MSDNNLRDELTTRQEYIVRVYHAARVKKLCGSQKDFARLVKVSPATLSQALNGSPVYLTENLEIKVRYFAHENGLEEGEKELRQVAEAPAQNSGVFIPEETRAMFENMAETIRIQAQMLARLQGGAVLGGAYPASPKNFRTDTLK